MCFSVALFPSLRSRTGRSTFGNAATNFGTDAVLLIHSDGDTDHCHCCCRQTTEERCGRRRHARHHWQQTRLHWRQASEWAVVWRQDTDQPQPKRMARNRSNKWSEIQGGAGMSPFCQGSSWAGQGTIFQEASGVFGIFYSTHPLFPIPGSITLTTTDRFIRNDTRPLR